MLLKYDFDINIESVVINLKRLVNQIYKLLPMREEQVDPCRTSKLRNHLLQAMTFLKW